MWFGAALCSIALVVAGGLVLSTLAVNRYLQASTSAMHRGDATGSSATPDPTELASVERLVSSLTSMAGVSAATSAVGTGDPVAATPVAETNATPAATPGGFSYDVSVVMDARATASQAAAVVFAMTKQLANARVNLELVAPAGAGHAASVVDYRHVFDAPVARSTVDSVSQAVAVAASVPGVQSVHVTVPYTWNLESGDLAIQFASDDLHHTTALKNALARTALSGVDWGR